MAGLRKSPLNPDVLKDNSIVPRGRKVIDIGLLKQKATIASKTVVVFDFSPLLNDSEQRRKHVIRLARALSERLKDSASVDAEYNMYLTFQKYCRYCENSSIDPFSKEGFLSYVGQNGELHRRIALAKKPLAFLYLYAHEEDICSGIVILAT